MKKNLTPYVLSHDIVWAILPKAAEQLLAQIGAVDAESHLAHAEEARIARAGIEDTRDDKPYRMFGVTAIIEVTGPMTKKGSSFGSGGTVETRNLLRRAGSDADVQNILIIWDSPGGAVSGTEDLASDIALIAKKKTVVSYLEDCCASAALWCATQSTYVYANSTAIVGSIGVFSYAVDFSEATGREGIKVHLLTTGRHKGVGVPGVPIDDDQLAELQRTIDTLGEHFFSAVAAGRKLPRAKVDEIADGRCWIGAEAVEAGLVDEVATLDEVLAMLQKQPGRKGARAETTEDLVADSPLLTDATLRTALDTALIAGVRASEAATVAMTRATEVKNLRASQNRAYSVERLEQLRDLAEVAELLQAKTSALLTECEALGADPGKRAEEAALPIAEDETRAPADFDRAALDARFELSLSHIGS